METEESDIVLPSVYLETTIVSYLTARPSRDLIIAAQQELSRQWWAEYRRLCRVFISPYVIQEAQAGDSGAAEERLRLLRLVESLELTPEIESMARRIQSALDIPVRSELDAFHVACAVEYELDYMLTWNCAHLANAHNLRRLADFVQREGLWLPIICTPAEMVETREEG